MALSKEHADRIETAVTEIESWVARVKESPLHDNSGRMPYSNNTLSGNIRDIELLLVRLNSNLEQLNKC